MHAELRIDAPRAARNSKPARTQNAAPAIGQRIGWTVFQTALLATLYFGWINRHERHWTPENGLGYWLGIAGVAALLLLLVYPLRKRFKSLRSIGSVPAWFRLHMALGMVAPTLILLHCNFGSASANASVALYSMLLVAASGFIGRYLYRHVYSHLGGRRIEAAAFFDEARDEMAAAGYEGAPGHMPPAAFETLTELTAKAIAPHRTLLEAVRHRLSTARASRAAARDLVDELAYVLANGPASRILTRRERKLQLRSFERHVSAHCRAIRRAASLAVYERLFALWHVLHLPLFVMLLIAVVVHIVAVHLY